MLPAIILVGGVIFMRFVVVPALGDKQQDELQDAFRRRWAKLVMLSAALLLISGLYNTAMKAMSYDLDTIYNSLLGIKILLALVILFLASVLAGRSEIAKKFREKESFWLNVNIVLAVALVCIAGFMKSGEYPEKPDESPEPETTQIADTF